MILEMFDEMKGAMKIEVQNAQSNDVIVKAGVYPMKKDGRTVPKRIVYSLASREDEVGQKKFYLIESAMKSVVANLNEKEEKSIFLFSSSINVDGKIYDGRIIQPIFKKIYQQERNKKGKLFNPGEKIGKLVRVIDGIYHSEEEKVNEVEQKRIKREKKRDSIRERERLIMQKDSKLIIGRRKIGVLPVLLQNPLSPKDFIVIARFDKRNGDDIEYRIPYMLACGETNSKYENTLPKHETFFPTADQVDRFNYIDEYTYFVNTNREAMEKYLKELKLSYIKEQEKAFAQESEVVLS